MTYTPLSTQIRKYPGTLGDLPLALHRKIFEMSNRARARELWRLVRERLQQAFIIRKWGSRAKQELWKKSMRAERYDDVYRIGAVEDLQSRSRRVLEVFFFPFVKLRFLTGEN